MSLHHLLRFGNIFGNDKNAHKAALPTNTNTMRLLNWILGRKKSKTKPYIDAGVALIFKLTSSLNLPGWKEGLPSYTLLEMEAINRRMSSFQKTANDVIGEPAVFHPEAIPDIQRMMSAEALIEMASDAWKFSDEVPADWRDIVATYLKGWAASFNPRALTELGDLLIKVDCRNEAKEVFRVLLLFPTYADAYFSGQQTRELVDDIVNSAKDSLQKLG